MTHIGISATTPELLVQFLRGELGEMTMDGERIESIPEPYGHDWLLCIEMPCCNRAYQYKNWWDVPSETFLCECGSGNFVIKYALPDLQEVTL